MALADYYDPLNGVIRTRSRLALLLQCGQNDLVAQGNAVLGLAKDVLNGLFDGAPGADWSALTDADRDRMDQGLLLALAGLLWGPMTGGERVTSEKTALGSQDSFATDATDPRPDWLKEASSEFAQVSVIGMASVAQAEAAPVMIFAAGGSRKRPRSYGCCGLSRYGIERMLQGITVRCEVRP